MYSFSSDIICLFIASFNSVKIIGQPGVWSEGKKKVTGMCAEKRDFGPPRAIYNVSLNLQNGIKLETEKNKEKSKFWG